MPVEDEKEVEEKLLSTEESKEQKKKGKKKKITYFVPMTFVLSERVKKKINTKPYLNILQRIDQQYPANERGDLLIFVRFFFSHPRFFLE